MKNTNKVALIAFTCLWHFLLAIPHAMPSDSIFDNVYNEYPEENYIVGIGEVIKTGNTLKDERVAEIMARTEIARQIRVKMEEETLDVACENMTGRISDNAGECRNEFLMIIKQSVNEVLVGSKIVEKGKRKGPSMQSPSCPEPRLGKGLTGVLWNRWITFGKT